MKLKEAIKKYPERELIYMYPENNSDYYYEMGRTAEVLIDRYWEDNGRVWLEEDQRDELEEHYECIFYQDMFESGEELSEEKEDDLMKKVREHIKNQEWKECICVYIG